MLELGADFVFTGEVLGQRPMSQRKQAMDLIEQKSGLEGILLRPLSARVLAETEIERKGWVRREYLLDIQGRSRKRQMAMAADLGITDYPAPAGGCILTDENYSRRLKDLFNHKTGESPTPEDAVLLSVGRHFRLTDDVKIVVGRDESENEYIEKVCNDDWLAFAAKVPGPTVAIQGESVEKELEKAASFAARYSDAKDSSEVDIIVRKIDQEKTLTVSPINNDELDRYRI
jgi:tRNA U34 2-thiouridine synthase MnmA/TrmU